MADDYGSCWCCGQYGIVKPAISVLGMCASCRGRSPSACQRAHQLRPVPAEQVQAWQDNTGAAFRQRWQAEKNARKAKDRTGRARRKPPATKVGMHRKRDP